MFKRRQKNREIIINKERDKGPKKIVESKQEEKAEETNKDQITTKENKQSEMRKKKEKIKK